MATLVKEKRREKKKQKVVSKKEVDLPPVINNLSLEDTQSTSKQITNIVQNIQSSFEESREDEELTGNTNKIIEDEADIESNMETAAIRNNDIIEANNTINNDNHTESHGNSNVNNSNYTENVNNIEYLSNDVQSTVLPAIDVTKNLTETQNVNLLENLEQNMLPSAPVLEEVPPILSHPIEQRSVESIKPKTQPMPLAEAIRVYGGKEIAEVKAMSEREEALVEAGPVSGYEHPLVDLLSTFRLSLAAVERERAQISNNIIEEEKARSQLWRIKKRTVYVSEKCRCGTNVDFKAVFDHAELLKEKLPVARMRLEALTRNVQESYCHHQHAALLAHCQIEDFISETVQSSKHEIREALSLILQALRLSDGTVEAYAHALQRWASALSAALVDDRDLRQLLYLLHHLFRQTRSVRWSARIVRMSVTDACSAARAIAVLDLLLARPGLENAVECTEELEAWEEVDVRGGAGGVGEGRLRERDLLALLRALPLRSLLARLALFPRLDVRTGSPLEWGDACGGHGVLKCACGARALLDVLRRATHAHATYTRLRDALRTLASNLLHALAALHLHSGPLYLQELDPKIQAELEACFAAGFDLIGDQLDRLPTSLLTDSAARHYCVALMLGLHDKTPLRIEALGVDAPVSACDVRVRVVTQAAVDRSADHELARSVLEFLFQTGIKRAVTGACTGVCVVTAREQLTILLSSHRYLHTTAFAVLADFHQAEAVEPSYIKHVCPEEWRPNPVEMRSVLDDWAQRCPLLIQHLLLQLNYTPQVGLSLETQLTVGSWLCWWVSQSTPEPEWCWAVLCKLCVHRIEWNLPLEAPPPEDTKDLFSTAYALLSSSWGHCIPLACGEGAEGLVRVAAVRPNVALRLAAPLLRLMAASPDSLAYTPKFTEAFTILLNAGPSLVQRALGRGGLSGADKLQRLVVDQLAQNRYSESASSLLSAWLHALWKLSLPVSSRAILDAAVRSCLQWTTLDAHVSGLLQEENSKEYVADAVRNAHIAPLLCEATLRVAHAGEVRTALHARLLAALWAQHRANTRIHVDNALKQINANITADELVIHRTAVAVLTAPFNHPAHLSLWRLFFHIYLQRPPSSPQENTAPIGPLFFSGLVKSRVYAQLKKRLQDTATYHQRQTELLKVQPKTDTPPERPARHSKASPSVDSNMFPSISIQDLTGESLNDSLSDEDDVTGTSEDVQQTERETNSQDTFHLICYHSAAEKLIRVYARWLEDGENVRALPHHADTARFVPEQALDAAWRSSIPTPTPSADSPITPIIANTQGFTCPNAIQSHYERAVQIILSVKDTSHRRPRKTSISSPLDGVNFNDRRSLLALVDKLLAEIRALADEWSSEVRYIGKLDRLVWELVGALRVRRALPPVTGRCTAGCKPFTVRIQEDEWCLSPGAEQGIQENRRSARASLRRLARARPAAARTAAALLSLASRVRNKEDAVRIVERASGYADSVEDCIISKQTLTALVTNLAERWISHDGGACASLIRSWARGSAAQQALCGAVVCPRRLPPAAWPTLYTALLSAGLPPHAAFSYLSKFEMSRWSESAESSQRKEVLDALVAAAQSLAPISTDQDQVLLELVGVHAAAVVTRVEVCAFACVCARAAAARRLPPAFCAALAAAVDAHAAHLPFDQLGHVQRELGVIWWEARTSSDVTPASACACAEYAEYAEHFTVVLRSLQRAFVAAAIASSYEPARVSWYAWSSVRESWAPWVSPVGAAPLLPSTGEREAYTLALHAFRGTLQLVMDMCPGSEESLLRQVWEWIVTSFLSVHQPRSPQESRVQLSALLAELARLPWHHQWYHLDCLKITLQAVSTGDKDMSTWLGETWRAITATTWLRGATDDTVSPALAALLALFLSPHAQHSPQTLLEACNLPWHRLPEAALEEALERFFIDHYNVDVPYHDTPQFIVVLSASELRVPASAAASLGPQSRGKRGRGVTRWALAAAAPALLPHVRAHTAALLAVISALVPYIENSAGELEELLSRAMAIMYMEAASTALPVWEQWVSSCGPRLRLACASAVAMLTALEYFAPLADAVAKAQMADKESTGWGEVRVRWCACAWAASDALATRGALHAAYAMLLATTQTASQMRATFNALASLSIHFTENEAIIGVWICVACRYARVSSTGDEEAQECTESGAALLTRWGSEPRRSLLQVMALQAATGCPTPQHRLLCKLGQCIISPGSESAVQSYEAACAAVLGAAAGDAASWGRSPVPKRLPRLAMRLYPNYEIYFREELQLAPDAL